MRSLFFLLLLLLLSEAAFESISAFQAPWRAPLSYVASQYAASDFYPITLCRVRGHTGQKMEDLHFCASMVRYSPRMCRWLSLWIIQRLHPHTEERGTGLHGKQICSSPSSQIWSVGHCRSQIITWFTHTHTPCPSCLSSPGLRHTTLNNSLSVVRWLKFGSSGPPT